MLQDIYPHIFHNEFRLMAPADDDIIICVDGRKVLMDEKRQGQTEENCLGMLPTYGEIASEYPDRIKSFVYLISVDDTRYFSPVTALKEHGRFHYASEMLLREMDQDPYAFAASVAIQLTQWYQLHQFCGRCGCRTRHSEIERAIICPECHHTYYPRINPVVIIAVTDGNRLLLTRYNRSGYRRHALVAGFVEVGETLEEAVQREIMEEVGLKVKNIRYCESQPWPFSSSLIAGFFADVDGSPEVTLNTDGGDELKEAVWVEREKIEIEDNNVSLTWDMIRRFKAGQEPG